MKKLNLRSRLPKPLSMHMLKNELEDFHKNIPKEPMHSSTGFILLECLVRSVYAILRFIRRALYCEDDNKHATHTSNSCIILQRNLQLMHLLKQFLIDSIQRSFIPVMKWLTVQLWVVSFTCIVQHIPWTFAFF